MVEALRLDVQDDEIIYYPYDKPYAMRDQGVRCADQTCLMVIGDVADVLEDEGHTELAAKARELFDEASALFTADDGWVDTEKNLDAPDILRDILQQAEQLDHIYVDWDGDAGIVFISISDHWVRLPAEPCGCKYGCDECNGLAYKELK